MRNIFKFILFLTGYIWSYIYPLHFSKKIEKVRDVIYSSWLSRTFNFFGKQTIIHYSCKLIGNKYIKLGNHVSVGKNSVITAWDSYEGQIFFPEIVIGDGTSIGEYAHISAINKILIGEGVLTGRWLTIVDNSHGKSDCLDLKIPPIHRPLYSKGIVCIGKNVWIGDKVTIMAGVVIGDNSIIGANSVVTKNIPENSVAGGIPAQIISK